MRGRGERIHSPPSEARRPLAEDAARAAPPKQFLQQWGMANLTLVYGMRLLPADEVASVSEAPIALKNGNEAHVTMHVLEGSREQIEAQLRLSIDAFFDFYPEI
jgi:hypothetical protein